MGFSTDQLPYVMRVVPSVAMGSQNLKLRFGHAGSQEGSEGFPGYSGGPMGLPTDRRRNLRSKSHKNNIFDKIRFLIRFGLVLRSDSESA